MGTGEGVVSITSYGLLLVIAVVHISKLRTLARSIS